MKVSVSFIIRTIPSVREFHPFGSSRSSQTLLPVENYTPPQRIFNCIYYMILFLFGITVFVLFLVNRKKIVLDGSTGLVKKAVIKDVLANKGVLFFAGLTGIVMLLK